MRIFAKDRGVHSNVCLHFCNSLNSIVLQGVTISIDILRNDFQQCPCLGCLHSGNILSMDNAGAELDHSRKVS